MTRYYINKTAQTTGEHEIHTTECSWFSIINEKEYLGDFSNFNEALLMATIKGYKNIDGCYYCCNANHKR